MIGTIRWGDWLPGIGITGVLFALSLAGPLDHVETAVRGAIADWVPAPEASERVVAVDVERTGEREQLARLHQRLVAAGPTAIGYSLPLDRADHAGARRVLEALRTEHDTGSASQGPELLERALHALATDEVLAAAFAEGPLVTITARTWAGTGAGSTHAPTHGARALDPPPLLWPGRAVGLRTIEPPLARYLEAADLVVTPADPEDGLRLAWQQGDDWIPALATALRARAGGASPRIEVGRGVDFGDAYLATGPDLRVYPRQVRNRADVWHVDAATLLDGEVDRDRFAGRVVILGHAGAGAADPRPAGMLPLEVVAGQTAALLADDLLHLPAWFVWTRLAAFLAVALYLCIVLPRLGSVAGLAVTGLFAVLLINAEILALGLQAIWLPLAVPLTALVAGHVVHAGVRRVRRKVHDVEAELTSANVRLGEALRAEGRLDEALRRLRRCQPGDDVIECLYGLGLEFERRRRFGEAVEAFAWIERHRPGHRDCARRIAGNRQRQEQAALGLVNNPSATTTLLLDDGEVQKPMLGRYEVEREIGKGAMGVVYLGRDPRLGRAVAIKTLALDREFEGQSLAEIRARFLREAETAGRLKHPHIVTVHDVGEENDLAWIAMDYLEGTPMSDYAQAETLLAPSEVFAILAQVADALDHAHGEGVVHRDVKPENIIVDCTRGVATVTDFGVASVADHHKTRTGTILGTPSYMSPEQVAGERVDGRSDIFSAGVTLYQLLTGQLPFTGDSLSNLMYRITHERQREVRRLRPELPTCATTITNRCLAKEPERRYTSAAQLARALRRCAEKMNAGT